MTRHQPADAQLLLLNKLVLLSDWLLHKLTTLVETMTQLLTKDTTCSNSFLTRGGCQHLCSWASIPWCLDPFALTWFQSVKGCHRIARNLCFSHEKLHKLTEGSECLSFVFNFYDFPIPS